MPLSPNQDHPLVSVIMPTYNRFDYLSRSITSFLNQEFKDAELIVVDDGSEDRTFDIVNEFMEQDDRIRYLKHSHRRISRSKNAGIFASFGKYISFLDSDDEYTPDYLSKRISYMEQNPSLDLLHGAAMIIGDQYVPDRKDASRKIHLDNCIIGGTFFGKREVFILLGGFDQSVEYSEDSHLWDRAKKCFETAHFNHQGYIYYRNTSDSHCDRYALSAML